MLLLLLLAPAIAQEEDTEDVFDDVVETTEIGGMTIATVPDSLGFAFEPFMATFQILIAEPIALTLELITQQTAATFEEGPSAIQYFITMWVILMIYYIITLTPDNMLDAAISPLIVLLLVLGFALYVSPSFASFVVGLLSLGSFVASGNLAMPIIIIVVLTIFGGLIDPKFGWLVGFVLGMAVAGLGHLMIRLFVMPMMMAFAFIDMLVQLLFGVPLSVEFIVLFLFPLATTYNLIKQLVASLGIFSERTVTLLGLLTFVIFSKTGYNPLVAIFGGLLTALGFLDSGWHPLMIAGNIFLLTVGFSVAAKLMMISIALDQKELLEFLRAVRAARAAEGPEPPT